MPPFFPVLKTRLSVVPGPSPPSQTLDFFFFFSKSRFYAPIPPHFYCHDKGIGKIYSRPFSSLFNPYGNFPICSRGNLSRFSLPEVLQCVITDPKFFSFFVKDSFPGKRSVKLFPPFSGKARIAVTSPFAVDQTLFLRSAYPARIFFYSKTHVRTGKDFFDPLFILLSVFWAANAFLFYPPP